jgi:hypothetical protein
MKIRRISERSTLIKLKSKGGYLLNIGRSGAFLHRANCVTVDLMNPDKKGGIYYTETLETARDWFKAESIKGAPCRLCLPALTYMPRPEKLIDHIKLEMNDPDDAM